EDGIRDLIVTGVQTCALPICSAIKYELIPAPAGSPTRVTFNGKEAVIDPAVAKNITGFTAAAVEAGYPKAGDPSIVKVNGFFERSEERRVGKEGRCARGRRWR